MIDQTDHDLVMRVARQADRRAFEELVRRHQSSLRASMRKLTNGHAELADDVAQEAFILAWRNIGQFRSEAKFSTWLYRIGFNAWQSQVRKKSELLLDDMSPTSSEDDGAERASIVANVPDAEASPGEHVARATDISRAMASLNEAERNAIMHCYYQDLSHEEAAYVLGLPLGTLKTHILKAKEKMRLHLLEYATTAS